MKCRYCKATAVKDRTMCQKHLDATRASSERFRKRMKAEKRCVACGKKKLASKIYCKTCKILYGTKIRDPKPCPICKKKGHERKDHKVLGICWYCPRKVTADSNLCKKHHEERAVKRRKRARSYREKWRKEGRCVVCGKKAVTQTRCEKHRRYAADWERNNRRR